MTRAGQIELARIEAVQLNTLLDQFLEVLNFTPAADPALDRLAPSAYPDDEDADREFRKFTHADLLERRRDDAKAVQSDLAAAADLSVDIDDDTSAQMLSLAVDGERVTQWMRALSALRLVLAERIGIATDDIPNEENALDDPRVAIYDWLAYRLDSLVSVATGLTDATSSEP